MTTLCRICDRHFPHNDAWLQHNRDTSVHEWCDHCRRPFPHRQALNDHIKNSSEHAYCHDCGIDFLDQDDLRDHQSEEHCKCHDCGINHDDEEDLLDHQFEAHNKCKDCGEYFSTPNDVQQHTAVHLPRTMECWFCTEVFKSLAGMMIHLESGACTHANWDCQKMVDALDFLSGTWRNPDYEDDGNLLMCPGCRRVFSKPSSLLQHIESPSCDEDYNSTSHAAWTMLGSLKWGMRGR